MTDIKEHMEVIGADGVHVGTVDKVEGDRIKLTKKDSGEVATRATITSSTRNSSRRWKATRCGFPPLAP
jgi:hypothetical protein